jgi:hypothetical protein
MYLYDFTYEQMYSVRLPLRLQGRMNAHWLWACLTNRDTERRGRVVSTHFCFMGRGFSKRTTGVL